jgi:mercuric ion transport protein
MTLITRLADKAGSIGSIVSAMGCAMCFPAIASLGAAIGLDFLSRYEGLLLNTLLPVFAGIALVANALGWLSHRQWHRSVLGMIGPALVLAALYPLWKYGWSTYLFYAGLALMLAVSIWDIASPAHRVCTSDTCPTDAVKPSSS